MNESYAARYRRLLQQGQRVLRGLRVQLAQPDLTLGDRRALERSVAAQEVLQARYAGQEQKWAGRELADSLTPACRAFVPRKARPCFGALAGLRTDVPNENRKATAQ
jgi:hypothetical protein